MWPTVVLLALSLLLLALSGSGRRKPKGIWRELTDRSRVQEADPLLISLRALLGKRAVLRVVKHGGAGETTRTWLGVSGAADSLQAVETIAEAAGRDVKDSGPPPPMPVPKLRWAGSPPDTQAAGAGLVNPWHMADHLAAALNEGEVAMLQCRLLISPQSGSLAALPHTAGNDRELVAAAVGAPARLLISPWTLWLSLGCLGLSSLAFAAEAGWLGAQADRGIAAGVGAGVAVLGVSLAAAACSLAAAAVTCLASSPARRAASSYDLRPSGKPPRETPAEIVVGWLIGPERQTVTAPVLAAPEAVTQHTADSNRLGEDNTQRSCYLTSRDRQYGVMVTGDPGTGKTNFLLQMAAEDAKFSLGGGSRTVVWIETKGAGADEAAAAVAAAGAEPVRIKASSAEAPLLRIVDWQNPQRSASLLVDAMRYSFDQDDIHERAATILRAAFLVAVGLTPEVCADMGYTHPPNVMRAAHDLLGGAAEEDSEKLRVLARRAETPGWDDFARWVPPTLTAYKSKEFLGACVSKTGAFLPVEGLFAGGDTAAYTLEELLESRRVVLLDLSPDDTQSTAFTESVTKHLAAFTMFCLWDAIKRTCGDWQADGRSVAVYSDELSDIDGFGSRDLEVIADLADKGRSRGVMAVFATQRPRQLTESTREAVMSFGSRFYFRNDELSTAQNAAADLGVGFDPEEIRGLETGSCAARVRYHDTQQPTFTLRVPRMKL